MTWAESRNDSLKTMQQTWKSRVTFAANKFSITPPVSRFISQTQGNVLRKGKISLLSTKSFMREFFFYKSFGTGPTSKSLPNVARIFKIRKTNPESFDCDIGWLRQKGSKMIFLLFWLLYIQKCRFLFVEFWFVSYVL